MNITVSKDLLSEAGPTTYPYIGVSDANSDIVVLFIKPRTGVALQHHYTGVGDFSDYWDEKHFSPLKGSITLTQ